jgi:hypothetical protein
VFLVGGEPALGAFGAPRDQRDLLDAQSRDSKESRDTNKPGGRDPKLIAPIPCGHPGTTTGKMRAIGPFLPKDMPDAGFLREQKRQ